MGLISQLNRLALLLPEAIICGPSYAKFCFWMRSPDIVNSQKVWQLFTQPVHPLLEFFLNHYPPAPLRQLLCNFFTATQDRIAGVAQHYDISNDFYRLFLDRNYMFYSCADFLEAGETLEQAQEHKANYLLNLIAPQSGEKILDLGCGWGGMLQKIAKQTGETVNLIGYTLSHEQIRFIREKYNFSVEFQDLITTEYEANSFDKIYSIGVVEHIPPQDLLLVSQKLATALKPTGQIVHQFFCQLGEFIPTRLLAPGAKVFPGAELVSLKKHLITFERAELQIIHHSIHDYRPTLKAWFERLVANQAEAIRLVGLENYNKYQCYLAEASRLFEKRELLLMRFVLKRIDAPVAGKSPLPQKY